jgi:stage III sporulation protein AH
MIRRSKMKNIFKKNHIIITALAIMIIIAGYLSFTNEDLADKKDAVETEATNDGDYEEFTDAEEMDLVTVDDADAEGTEVAEADDATTADADDENADLADEDAETLVAEEKDETANNEEDELSDISDEDMLADAQEVSDNGELDLEEGVPGEAVLANAASTIDASYFASNKIEREQVRAKNKADYMDIINSTTVSKDQRQSAVDSMLELTDIITKENKTEMLLEAKGFAEPIVFMDDGKVDVVVNADALTDQQLAIIEEVVKDKTGVEVKDISINPVVVSE